MERIDWKTKNQFRWNDGTRTKDYPVINSHTYTINGVGESNIGLPPEMKGTTVIIYGHYQDQVDSLRILFNSQIKPFLALLIGLSISFGKMDPTIAAYLMEQKL